ncbi:hypothetical protein ACJZ2D_007788 [Fusarium nematophilum]
MWPGEAGAGLGFYNNGEILSCHGHVAAERWQDKETVTVWRLARRASQSGPQTGNSSGMKNNRGRERRNSESRSFQTGWLETGPVSGSKNHPIWNQAAIFIVLTERADNGGVETLLAASEMSVVSSAIPSHLRLPSAL